MDRKTAIRFGKVLYHTGKPCKYGHISARYVVSRNCTECDRISHGGIPSLTFKGHPEDIETLRNAWIILQAQRRDAVPVAPRAPATVERGPMYELQQQMARDYARRAALAAPPDGGDPAAGEFGPAWCK